MPTFCRMPTQTEEYYRDTESYKRKVILRSKVNGGNLCTEVAIQTCLCLYLNQINLIDHSNCL